MTESIRCELLRIVERVVRPLRAGPTYKLRVREELLAHLESIYDQEAARGGDESAALRTAAARFGDVAQLTEELQQAVPAYQRINYWLERWFGWRPPEHANRFMLRLTVQLSVLFSILLCLFVGSILIVGGPAPEFWMKLRTVAVFLLCTSIELYVLGLLYFKMRDAMFGAFGSVKSIWRIVRLGALMSLVTLSLSMAFIASIAWQVGAALQSAVPMLMVALAVPFYVAYSAYKYGPDQISHTNWECLDIEQHA